jgi:hypothetical protein
MYLAKYVTEPNHMKCPDKCDSHRIFRYKKMLNASNAARRTGISLCVVLALSHPSLGMNIAPHQILGPCDMF